MMGKHILHSCVVIMTACQELSAVQQILTMFNKCLCNLFLSRHMLRNPPVQSFLHHNEIPQPLPDSFSATTLLKCKQTVLTLQQHCRKVFSLAGLQTLGKMSATAVLEAKSIVAYDAHRMFALCLTMVKKWQKLLIIYYIIRLLSLSFFLKPFIQPNSHECLS